MKKLFTFCFALVITCCVIKVQAQIDCFEEVNFSLDFDGTANIIADDILLGSFPSGCMVSLDGQNYTDTIEVGCQNIGIFMIYVKDPSDNTCSGTINLEDKTAPVVIVDSEITVVLDDVNDVQTISVSDIDNGTYDLCSSAIEFSLSQMSFAVNNFGANTIELTATDEFGNTSSAFSVVNVTLDCDFDSSMINWPDTLIQLSQAVDPNLLTPAYLQSEFGLLESQVLPIVDGDNCIIGQTYEDVITISTEDGGNHFTIIRHWAIEDWVGQEVYYFDQLIKAELDQEITICDTLPHTAPVGDCASGHTLDDHVEWPADIAVDDHRMTPAQLMSISGVDAADAQPNFSVDQYSASYIDILDSIVIPHIYINRKWTATHEQLNYAWEYNQKIDLDISNFTQLVTVEDPNGTAMSDVTINGDVLTDDLGRAYIEDEVESISKLDNSIDQLDIIDLTMIYEHILALSTLTLQQQQIADITEDGQVTTLDLVFVKKYMAGEPIENFDFRFLVKNDPYAESSKGAYIGYKPGDVQTDSSNENFTNIEDEKVVSIEDIILNAGEQYEIPITLLRDLDMISYDLNVNIDSDRIEVIDVKYNDDKFIEWHEESDKMRIVAALADRGQKVFNANEVIGTLVIKAKKNTVLSNSINFQDGNMMLDHNKKLWKIGGNIDGVIPSSTKEVITDVFSIFPNPATDMVNVDFDTAIDKFKIAIRNINGELIKEISNEARMSTSELNSGIYIVELTTDEFISREKIVILK